MTSLNGKTFNRLDILCHNATTFLRKHYNALDFLFLSLYVLLQLILVIFIELFKKIEITIISIFIILFLFLISCERIIFQFKSRQAQEEKDNAEEKYYELKSQNKTLKERINYITEILNSLQG